MTAYLLAALFALAPAAIITYLFRSRTFFVLAIIGAFIGGVIIAWLFAPNVTDGFQPGVTERDRIIADTKHWLPCTTAGAILFGSLAWWTAESTRKRPPFVKNLHNPKH